MFAAAAVRTSARQVAPLRAAPSHTHAHRLPCWSLGLAAVLAAGGPAAPLVAQALNWEGVAGGVVTPHARLATPGGLSRPTVAFHLLNGGDVIGRRYQTSFAFGFGGQLELGYTRSSVTSSDVYQRLLFDRGFNTLSAKVRLLPAVSGGVIWRWQNKHLSEGLGVATKNADIYLVATRHEVAGPSATLLLNGGVRLSNASLMGIAGNAPGWQPLFFGSVGASFAAVVTVAAEYLPQPREIDGMAGAELPATVAGYVRFAPRGGRVAIDLAVLRMAGEIMTGFDAAAEARALLGVSYSFQ